MFFCGPLDTKFLWSYVCTFSPICRSDIRTESPFSRVRRDVDGKQPNLPEGGGGGGVGGGGMCPVHQQQLSGSLHTSWPSHLL